MWEEKLNAGMTGQNISINNLEDRLGHWDQKL
jgi:hypothetical protein